MSAAHTPGPWRVERGPNDETTNLVGIGDGIVAECVPLDYDEETQDTITGEETQANAHLIAAAPELLDALGALMGNILPPGESSPTGPGSISDSWRLAKAAIAKAEGRDQ